MPPISSRNVLLTHIRTCYRVTHSGQEYLAGAEMADVSPLHDAYIRTDASGKIAEVGEMKNLDLTGFEGRVVDCAGRLVFPGFVDSHTHLVYPRTREQEFTDRIKGLSYEEIARRGGGILNSARATRGMSEQQLLEDALRRAEDVLAMGTTTIEIKSGYGLDLESELKLLRVARQVGKLTPLRVKTTFLGAHAVPPEFASDPDGYLRLVVEEMLPAVVDEGLADHIDVFCDTGFFTPDQTRLIVEDGWKRGLPGKIHANELANSGGVQAGVETGCWSVDHLERIGDAEIAALRMSTTVPCVLPTVAFFLGIPYAPARQMIAAGLPLALATDLNPGSSPGGSMPFVLSLACTQLRLLPEEALAAATLNGAFALRMHREVGSIEPGKWADLIVTEPMDDLAAFPYHYDRPRIAHVLCARVG
jgi:imidazolonepropionase